MVKRALAIAALFLCGDAAGQQALLDFGGELDVATIPARDARVRLDKGRRVAALRIETGHRDEWPGITLAAPGGRWDLTGRARISIAVENLDTREVTVCCRVDNPGADGTKHCVTGSIELGAGQRSILSVALVSHAAAPPSGELFGMRGYPGRRPRLDLDNITQLLIFVPRPRRDHRFRISAPQVVGSAAPPTPIGLPMIDTFGQYMHREWPGKIQREEQLHDAIERESAELRKHPGPVGWNVWGGWKRGPRLRASGHFRASKHAGRWWLVDPEGYLFWSHGIDCVHGHNATTPIDDREHYFAALPAESSPRARFFGRASWAPRGHYKGRSYRTFDFSSANLQRKYGAAWRERFAERTHRRLRSWGMNTIGNWSGEAIYLQRKTPYTVAVHFDAPPLRGSEGYWGQFPDVFDPAFERALGQRMERERERSAGDPWCLGYFIHNELSWGKDLSLAEATLASPPEQAAKRAFVADLRARHGDIAALNTAWGSAHASWDALLAWSRPPGSARAHADLSAFATRFVERYFRLCRAGVKAVAPENLYLGCRFAWANELVARIAARHCDVLSYNLYHPDVAGFRLPAGLDAPVIVGEFHFGALDRGLFHPGLQEVGDQTERALAYRRYVTSALDHPQIVGTHWFQYMDQAATGRGDGENYQIGFLDIADTPYAETVAASRTIGAQLYRRRISGD